MLPHAQKVCSRLPGRAKGNIPSSAVLFFLLLRQATTRDSVTAYPREELLRDWEFFVQPPPRSGHHDAAGHDVNGDAALTAARLDGRTTELEDEVARLKTQLARAKGINDVMWETFVQNMAAQGKDSEMPALGQIPADLHEDTDTDGRGRKRGKTKAFPTLPPFSPL
jgi:pre-rRNA-processing protein IPI3